jgi:hypothetical protein
MNINIPCMRVCEPDFEIDEYDEENDIKFKTTTINKIITTKFRCEISYPLSVKVDFKMEKAEGLTLKDILLGISKKYNEIYDEEERTTKLKTETINQRTKGKSKLINRANTNGKYGIWGHGIGDLVYEGLMFISIDKDGYYIYDLMIGS